MVARKDRGHWWVDFRFGAERIRRRSPVDTKRGAEQFERQLREEMLTPTPEAKEVPTLREFWPEFIAFAKRRNKPSEVCLKESIFLHHLEPAFGSKHLDEITTRSIDRYTATKTSIHPKTVNNTLTVLRKALATAQDWGLLETLPKFNRLKAPKPKFDFLSSEESERLLAAAEDEWRVALLVSLRTGIRQGEFRALRWEDVDLVAGRMTINQSNWRGIVGTPKSGHSRDIPLSTEVVKALKGHRHLIGDLVFCHPTGRAWNPDELRPPLYRACKKAGLRRIGWHVMRHSFASQLVTRGVPLKAVQEMLGHATMDVTLRYSHLSPDVSRDAVERLSGGAEDRRGHYLVTKGEPNL